MQQFNIAKSPTALRLPTVLSTAVSYNKHTAHYRQLSPLTLANQPECLSAVWDAKPQEQKKSNRQHKITNRSPGGAIDTTLIAEKCESPSLSRHPLTVSHFAWQFVAQLPGDHRWAAYFITDFKRRLLKCSMALLRTLLWRENVSTFIDIRLRRSIA